VFKAKLDAADLHDGIFLWQNGVVETVVSPNDVTITPSVGSLAINDAGEVAFKALTVVSADQDQEALLVWNAVDGFRRVFSLNSFNVLRGPAGAPLRSSSAIRTSPLVTNFQILDMNDPGEIALLVFFDDATEIQEGLIAFESPTMLVRAARAAGLPDMGSGQGDPLLPDGVVSSATLPPVAIGFEFRDVVSGAWIANDELAAGEPAGANAYRYTLDSSTVEVETEIDPVTGEETIRIDPATGYAIGELRSTGQLAFELELPAGPGGPYFVDALVPNLMPPPGELLQSAGPFAPGTVVDLLEEFTFLGQGLPLVEFTVRGAGVVRAEGFPLRVVLNEAPPSPPGRRFRIPNTNIQQVAFVPEPAVAVLQAAALLALAGLRRRRYRHAGGSAEDRRGGCHGARADDRGEP
jgi:hypothetical protein